MQKKHELSPKLKDLLLDKKLTPDRIELEGKPYTDLEPIDSGFKSVVWKAYDNYRRPRAIKFAIPDDYQHEERTFYDEIKFADQISRSNMFARLHDAGNFELRLKDGTKFQCFFLWKIGLREFLLKIF